jgi:DNA-binding response OmpR family regulator
MIRQNPHWETIPIIVLTGLHDDNHLIARARELGVADLIPKATFGFQDLLVRIRKVIAGRMTSPN